MATTKTRTSKTKSYKRLDNVTANIIETERGRILSLVEEIDLYSFRNTLNGPFYFEREDKSAGCIEGKQIADDITEKERRGIIKSGAFRQGYIVEESSDLPTDEFFNRNALNEKQLSKLFEKHSSEDSEYWKEHIEQMDSEIALKRLREAMNSSSFPNSLITYCDARLNTIQEEYLESMEEPIAKGPKGV